MYRNPNQHNARLAHRMHFNDSNSNASNDQTTDTSSAATPVTSVAAASPLDAAARIAATPDGFANLGLDPNVLRAAKEAGYTEPTPIQAQAIPAALAGQDILASSHTGSGKTAAFLLPALHRLATNRVATSVLDRHKRQPAPRVLVLAPTRELALQVQKAAFDFSRAVRGVRTAALVGGAAYGLQLKALREGADIVVATPGRLIDHLNRGPLDLSKIEVLVLDEADRMLDMGFVDDIEAIVAKTPANRQTLLFSATLDGVVGNLARRLTRSPVRVQVVQTVESHAAITQKQFHTDGFSHKGRLLDALLRDVDLQQAIVFTSTKKSADDLSDALVGQGFPAAALHGDMMQRDRNRTLHRLRDGQIRVLVATDVAARGIDVSTVTHVINFDLPRQAEDYVHRIGRTGRAGRTGLAISFVAPDEHRQIKLIERFTGQPIEVDVVPGLEPTVQPRRASEGRKPGGGRGGYRGTGGRPGGGGGGGFKSSGDRRGGSGGGRDGWSGSRPARGR
jgi:superfamily II DNA/RNA helicase